MQRLCVWILLLWAAWALVILAAKAAFIVALAFGV